ncbi:hypothetical protein ACTXT7_009188 [Hymenolepis weldensis]
MELQRLLSLSMSFANELTTIMKVHNADRTYKSILLNDDMRVGQICEIMLDKNHRRDSIVHWQIFEEPGDFPGFETLRLCFTVGERSLNMRGSSVTKNLGWVKRLRKEQISHVLVLQERDWPCREFKSTLILPANCNEILVKIKPRSIVQTYNYLIEQITQVIANELCIRIGHFEE